MKRIVKYLLCVTLLLCCLTACGEKEPELPDGVIAYRDHYYYVINLSRDEISDYFTLTGPTNTYVVTSFGKGGTGVTGSVTVEFRKAAQGGWIAYSKSVNKIIYIPPEYSEDEAPWVAQKLSGELNSYMSIEQAREYISFIK